MGLTERKVLRSVEVLTQQKTANACWENQILRDGEILSSVPHRCAYGIEQKEQFLAEVDNAAAYIAILGW